MAGWDLGDGGDVAASDCEKKSVGILSIELDRFFPSRGELELEPTEEADVEAVVGIEKVDTDEVEMEEDLDVELVNVAMVAGVIVDVLLCCARCCGRDMTLKDDGGGRCRMGVGMIRLSSGSSSAGAGGGVTSSTGDFGIMNLRAGMMSSSSTSSGSGDTTRVTTTRFRADETDAGEIERCGPLPRAAVTELSGPREGDLVSVSSGTDHVDKSLDIRR